MHIRLKALKPKHYPVDPKTFGEHLRKRRLESHLTLREAGKLIGVSMETLMNWEKDRTFPLVTHFPKVLGYLGYYPFLEPTTMREQLLRKRREMGWTIDAAAEAVRVDPGTWGGWEAGQAIAYPCHQSLVSRLLGEIVLEDGPGGDGERQRSSRHSASK